MLLIERHDRTPPLAFPGGKIEAGETLVQAAVRGVLEETAIDVTCHELPATRTHLDSGRHIACTACTSRDTVEPRPAAREALTASWWSIDRALTELASALHHAVAKHLCRQLLRCTEARPHPDAPKVRRRLPCRQQGLRRLCSIGQLRLAVETSPLRWRTRPWPSSSASGDSPAATTTASPYQSCPGHKSSTI
ncbi:NUDIX hydrolase [Actinomycetospora sp. OC33-EN08]|uniref:NUDIX hydrolase n=1 Tax=Actinomycetospora aurantiaca TaxID=3129233 RepID=A0ABU8MTJ5_9PSEU